MLHPTPQLALLAPLALLPCAPDDEPWTGVLDEESFAALHELKEGAAPELAGEDVKVGETAAYLSEPPAGEPLGGVVVIHEWWGLNDHVKHWADRLAADGYVALAVDLYGGTVATTREEAMEAMRAVDEAQALATLRAAHDFLQEDERAAVERTASIGWCFGGGWSLRLAMAEPELDAAVVYYGRVPGDAEELRSIEAPVLGVFGDRDSGIPPDVVKAFAAAMDGAGKDLELATYDAEHAFANPSGARYDAENAADAWRVTRGFLCRHLWPEEPPGLVSDFSRELDLDAPEGWERQEPKPMRVVTFRVGKGTECYVSALPGAAGGVVANLGRWCTQFGQEPLDEEEIEELPHLPMLGRLAPVLRVAGDFTDMRGETVEGAAMLGAMSVLEREAIFVKLVGPEAEVDAAAAAFATFCRSLR